MTLGDAVTALGQRLLDTSQVRWISTELVGYITEALRTWSAYAQPFHDVAVWNTSMQEPFYDLRTMAPALRADTVTDRDLLQQIEYHLLEPPSAGGTWLGSSQFTLAAITAAMQRRRDQFLLETGAVLTRTIFDVSPPPNGRIALPANTLNVHRLAWRLVPSQIVVPMYRDDEWGMTHYRADWVQAPQRPPQVYSTAAVPFGWIQVAPPPLDTGQLDLLAIQAGSILNVATPVILGIPDDWSWVLKWGVLADLLSQDGVAQDPNRAAYCDARWTQGIQAARKASVTLTARINNRSVRIGTIADADKYAPLWQSVAGVPVTMLTAGQNLVACWPPPGAVIGGGDYSITVDVVRKVAVSTALATVLPLTADQFDILIDYAQHLATFKNGPQALIDSQPLLDRFLRYVGVTIAVQQASQPARKPLLDQTIRDQQQTPVQAEVPA